MRRRLNNSLGKLYGSGARACIEWKKIVAAASSGHCIFARDNEKLLLIAVCDEGMKGKGITRAQAEKLFTAFGRLETHAAIEGTRLGLLSVRKIVEAQGGAAFIEGRENGAPDAPLFSTAAESYPSMLRENLRTALVVTCPLAAKAS